MEGDARAQLDRPDLGVGAFDALCQLHLRYTALVEECQAIVERAAAHIVRRKRRLGRIQRVGGRGGPAGSLQVSARFRRCGIGAGGAPENGPACRHCNAAGQQHVEKLTPRCAAANGIFDHRVVRWGPIGSSIVHVIPLLLSGYRAARLQAGFVRFLF